METLLNAGLSNAVTATFLALAVACLGRLLARRPAVLHSLWLFVLLKLVTPPLYDVAVPWPDLLPAIQEPRSQQLLVLAEPIETSPPSVQTVPGPVAPAEWSIPEVLVAQVHDADWLSVHSEGKRVAATLGDGSATDWIQLATAIWIAGSSTIVVVSGWRIRRFRVLLREAQPAAEETQEWVGELAMRLGVLRAPSVWWISGRLSPLVWALGLRSRLIIPTDLWKLLDDRQRATLVVHELAHLRRGDHRVRIFELIVTALFWWHPVVWWARQALHDVEEQCCDAWVIWAFPESARSYAETLLETLDFLHDSDRPAPLLASGFGKVDHLRKRLTMIMSGTTPRLLGVRGTLAALGMGVLLLPVNATWAQKSDDKKEVRVIVKSDDNSSQSSDSVASVGGDGPGSSGEGIVEFDPAGDGKLRVFRIQKGKSGDLVEAKSGDLVEAKSGDAAAEVTANPNKQALEKLKEQIKVLARDLERTNERSKIIALQRALKDLEGQTAKTNEGQSGDLKIEKGKGIVGYLPPLVDDAKISPEQKAEIAKARARVDELSRSLEANQKKLVEAKQQLAKLARSYAQGTISVGTLGKVTTRIAPVEPVPANHFSYTIVRKKGIGEGDQQRLAEIEKTLKQLLEEVASLKNAREK